MMSAPESSDSPASAQSNSPSIPYPSERYAWYVVIILMIVYVFSFVDRQMLSLLVDPIKADLGSGTQISYLGGFTFALFYTFFGIPIALGRRKPTVLITVGLAVWSFFTMLCGTASRFWTFAFYRMRSAWAGQPLTVRLLNHYRYFGAERLAVAIGSAGIYIGSGLAQVFGGIVIGFAMSATELTVPFAGPASAVAIWRSLSWLALHAGFTDRQRTDQAHRSKSDPSKVIQPPPISQVVAYIRANSRTFLFHNLGIAHSFVSHGAAYWVPSYLIRVHGLSAQNRYLLWLGGSHIGTAGLCWEAISQTS